MATYSQWSKSKAEPRRVTWLCGPESVLANEVADAIIGRTSPDLCLRLFAGEEPEADVWAQACSYPDVTRVVLVRDAHELRSWELLPDAAEVARASGHLVLVSADPDVHQPSRPGQPKVPYPGVQAVLGVHGQVVRCAISAENQGERVAWVRRRLPDVTEEQARVILSRCGQRLSAVSGFCERVRRSGVGLSYAIREAMDDLAAEEVADALVLNDRAEALRAATELDPEDYGAVIGQLSGRLDVMISLHEAVQQRAGARDAESKFGVPPFLFAKFRSAASDYGPDKVIACRQLLARVDDAYMTGARDAIPEALIACW